jgi:hypothetical protein
LPKKTKVFLNFSWINISSPTKRSSIEGKNKNILKFPTQDKKINKKDKILHLGGLTGYVSVILSKL